MLLWMYYTKLEFPQVDTVLEMALDPFNPAFNPLTSSSTGTCGVAARDREEEEEKGQPQGQGRERRRLSAAQREFVRERAPAWAPSLICSCSS
jgi:hypothetical protein